MCKVSAQQLVPTAVSQSSPVVFMLSRQKGQPWIILFGNGPVVIRKEGKKRRGGGGLPKRGRSKEQRGVAWDLSSKKIVIGAQQIRTILPKAVTPHAGSRRRGGVLPDEHIKGFALLSSEVSSQAELAAPQASSLSLRQTQCLGEGLQG